MHPTSEFVLIVLLIVTAEWLAWLPAPSPIVCTGRCTGASAVIVPVYRTNEAAAVVAPPPNKQGRSRCSTKHNGHEYLAIDSCSCWNKRRCGEMGGGITILLSLVQYNEAIISIVK